MSVLFFTDFPFSVGREQVMTKMHMQPEHPYVDRIDALLEQALAVAKPKALFSKVAVDAITADTVQLDGIVLKSKIMGKNFGDADFVYPYLCTCGREVAAFAETVGDIMDQFILDAIMELLLMEALLTMIQALENTLEKGQSTSSVSPGSLIDWPVLEQKKLFQLYYGGAEKIGVTLTPSFLMQPVKSVSGIRYVSDYDFHNCDLCQREDCPSRQSPFNVELYVKNLAD